MIKRLPWFLVIGGILILIVLGFLLFASPFGGPGAPSTDGDGTTDGDNGPVTNLDDLFSTKNFLLAGITDEDTITVIDDTNDEVPIRLDHKDWNSLDFSPDNSAVTVLGRTGGTNEQPIYDLFVFRFSDAKWEQLTFYQDARTGITGYGWLDSETIAFTQTASGQTWVHYFDFPNLELSKAFQITGDLYKTSFEYEQIVIREETSLDLSNFDLGTVEDFIYKVYNRDGEQIQRLRAFDELGGPTVFVEIEWARSASEFVFEVVDYEQDLDSRRYPAFGQLDGVDAEGLSVFNGQILCIRDANLAYAIERLETGFEFGVYNLVSESFASFRQVTHTKDFSFLAIEYQCGREVDLLLARNSGASEVQEIYEIDGSQIRQRFFANSYLELIAKVSQ